MSIQRVRRANTAEKGSVPPSIWQPRLGARTGNDNPGQRLELGALLSLNADIVGARGASSPGFCIPSHTQSMTASTPYGTPASWVEHCRGATLAHHSVLGNARNDTVPREVARSSKTAFHDRTEDRQIPWGNDEQDIESRSPIDARDSGSRVTYRNDSSGALPEKRSRAGGTLRHKSVAGVVRQDGPASSKQGR